MLSRASVLALLVLIAIRERRAINTSTRMTRRVSIVINRLVLR
jgi:hypothetical protein